MVRRTALLLVFSWSLIAHLQLVGQQTILGLGTSWSDSFKEWNIQTENDDRAGELRLTWAFKNDWTEWDFRLGDTTATIRQKWKDDPDLWEVRCLDKTVTARTTWRGDTKSWRFEDGSHTLTFQSKYSNTRDEWEIRRDDHGFFSVYTYYEGDPRDWVVKDELDEDVSFAMRIAMMFIAIYHSTPKV